MDEQSIFDHIQASEEIDERAFLKKLAAYLDKHMRQRMNQGAAYKDDSKKDLDFLYGLILEAQTVLGERHTELLDKTLAIIGTRSPDNRIKNYVYEAIRDRRINQPELDKGGENIIILHEDE